MSTIVSFVFMDGSKQDHVELNYEQWQEMYRSGKWQNKSIYELEVEKSSDKAPEQIKFI